MSCAKCVRSSGLLMVCEDCRKKAVARLEEDRRTGAFPKPPAAETAKHGCEHWNGNYPCIECTPPDPRDTALKLARKALENVGLKQAHPDSDPWCIRCEHCREATDSEVAAALAAIAALEGK